MFRPSYYITTTVFAVLGIALGIRTGATPTIVKAADPPMYQCSQSCIGIDKLGDPVSEDSPAPSPWTSDQCDDSLCRPLRCDLSPCTLADGSTGKYRCTISKYVAADRQYEGSLSTETWTIQDACTYLDTTFPS